MLNFTFLKINNHALQRTEAGGELFSGYHVLLRQPLSLSLEPLGPSITAMSNPELLRARWFAGAAGFLSGGTLPVLLLFSCAAPKFLASPLRYHVGGRPMPALTDWLLSVAEHLPSGGFALCALLFGPFVLAFSLLLFAVCRASSVASVALSFSLWVGLLLTVELLVVCFVAFALLLPFALSTGKLQTSLSTHQGLTTRSSEQRLAVSFFLPPTSVFASLCR